MILHAHGVSVQGARVEQQSLWGQLLVASFHCFVIIAVFMFFMRQMQGGVAEAGAVP